MPAPSEFSAIATRWVLGAVAAVGIGAASLSAVAQDATPADVQLAPEDVQRQLDQRRDALQATEQKAKTLESDLSAIDVEREKLNAELLTTASRIQLSEGQLSSIEGRLGELEAQEKLVRGSLMERHGKIATLLGALQRMGRNPPPVMFTQREDALEMVRSAMLLASAFPGLKSQATALSEQLDELVRVMANARAEGERLKAETARLNEARTQLTGLMAAKKLTLAERKTELASVKAANEEIKKSVDNLSELIQKLDSTVTQKTGLGAYQIEREAQGGAVKVAPPPPETVVAAADPAATADSHENTGPALTPPPRLKPQIVELAPSSAGMLAANPGRIKPAMPFVTAHAKLPLPVQGRRVLAFGESTQFGAKSKGVVIETRASALVTAPCDGWVEFAGEFRSYGQLLIINAGDGYHVLLAGMSQIDAQPGQFVLAAEPIGMMNGAASGSASSIRMNAPVLYVEFRKDGRPIDPDPWWVAGQQKVQG
ncbi:MAG: murein hydrolase activator EnvC family protein [Hyphomicrobium sp.]